ncbi:carboxypeptidase inhibitor SmCI-like [Trichoplusia ni]|uniref:Carboxypeptidase inhibitor SmCI-like n=1 Tax=Trichoplusia ni TaxID=7111 RepID=A0A7E5VVC1_TRINI|nr:carboxypeptidase inhibitor SmCI-like [Trichoplusia ni]
MDFYCTIFITIGVRYSQMCCVCKKMLFEFAWWTFWFYIFCHVQRAHTVRIFSNMLPTQVPKMTQFEALVRYKTCLLVPQLGPCRSKISMYYFDPDSKNCSTFTWGGCQGNGNRFDTHEDCMGFCLSKRTDNKHFPRFCSLTFDYGFCFGAVQRYYYDHAWKVCKTTIYSGCGGNQNNFYNLEQCESVCRFGRGAITTKRPVSGGTRKVLIINPNQ